MPWDDSQRAWGAVALVLVVVFGNAAAIILSHVF